VIVACHPKEISSRLIGRGNSSSDLAVQGTSGCTKNRDLLDVVNEGFISLLKGITDSSDFHLDLGVHMSSSHENLNQSAKTTNNLKNSDPPHHHYHNVGEDPSDLVEYSPALALRSGQEAFPATTTEHSKGLRIHLSTNSSSLHSSERKEVKNDNPLTGKIISEETRSTGSVSLDVYLYYFKACGGLLFGPLLVATMVWNSASWYFQNYSMGLWLNDLQSSTSSNHSHALADLVHSHTGARFSHLGWFLICCASVVLSTVAKNIYTTSGGLKASQSLHDRLVDSVLHTSCAWFDATPVGRISNRFSQDINSIDRELIGAIRGFFECFLGTAQVFVAVAINMPLLLIFLLPVITYVLWCTYLYVQASRELKRLESVAKSPVFVLFSETLNGLSTIRAFGQENRFFTDMCLPATDTMNSTHLILWTSNRWLSIRMTFAGAVVGGAVGFGVVLNAQKLGGAAAGLVLILALNLTDSLIFLARSYADVEMNLNSVERVYEYTNLTSEQYEPKFGDSSASLRSSGSSKESWPSEGKVEFRDVCMKYESNPEPILRGVSFTLMPRCKAGVVGRTGAGKSSLINVLFRYVLPMCTCILQYMTNMILLSQACGAKCREYYHRQPGCAERGPFAET
jgi:ABC-type multidrug transport system fused ATPase/permease subunit